MRGNLILHIIESGEPNHKPPKDPGRNQGRSSQHKVPLSHVVLSSLLIKIQIVYLTLPRSNQLLYITQILPSPMFLAYWKVLLIESARITKHSTMMAMKAVFKTRYLKRSLFLRKLKVILRMGLRTKTRVEMVAITIPMK